MSVVMCVPGHAVASAAMQQCPAGPALRVSTDPDSVLETRGNRRSISIMWASLTGSMSAVFFMSWGGGRLTGERQNNVEDAGRCRDANMEELCLSGGAAYHASVVCECWGTTKMQNHLLSSYQGAEWWNLLELSRSQKRLVVTCGHVHGKGKKYNIYIHLLFSICFYYVRPLTG